MTRALEPSDLPLPGSLKVVTAIDAFARVGDAEAAALGRAGAVAAVGSLCIRLCGGICV